MIKYIFRADARTRLGFTCVCVANRFSFHRFPDFSVKRDFRAPRYLARNNERVIREAHGRPLFHRNRISDHRDIIHIFFSFASCITSNHARKKAARALRNLSHVLLVVDFDPFMHRDWRYFFSFFYVSKYVLLSDRKRSSEWRVFQATRIEEETMRPTRHCFA